MTGRTRRTTPPACTCCTWTARQGASSRTVTRPWGPRRARRARSSSSTDAARALFRIDTRARRELGSAHPSMEVRDELDSCVRVARDGGRPLRWNRGRADETGSEEDVHGADEADAADPRREADDPGRPEVGAGSGEQDLDRGPVRRPEDGPLRGLREVPGGHGGPAALAH